VLAMLCFIGECMCWICCVYKASVLCWPCCVENVVVVR